MNTVRATFSGTADGQTYYANTGNAGGIKIEIQDRDGSNASYHNGMFKTLNVQNNNATFNLKARAVSKGQVTPRKYQFCYNRHLYLCVNIIPSLRKALSSRAVFYSHL